ncbi:hypothetical protein F4819DRAFT_64503 [Hypoxylon fuscum]|nr:hypothetical protein F4819DRAFT_64503 [Hypoxylon fuscum]
MSRSLDKDLLPQLKYDDPNKVFKDISTTLADLPDDELLEIEFIGKEFPLEKGANYFRDGSTVGVPKLRLVQAFFVARQILQRYQENSSTNSDNVVAATSVLLLMDPEHLTAANTRKRFLLSTLETNRMAEPALRREKQFVDSLLTSRLHRHTKSPTLWSHRRWLLHVFAAHDVSVDLQHDIKSIVMIAGERHPRNYTAWNHARFLLDRSPSLAEPVATDVKEYCLRHHTDISSWSFLSYAVSNIDDGECRHKICASIIADILGIADSFQWTNESVWVFLRNIAATELVSQQQFESFLAVNKKLASATPKGSDQWRTLDNARLWCEKHRLPTSSKLADTSIDQP